MNHLGAQSGLIGQATDAATAVRAWLASGAVQSPSGAYCAWAQNGSLAFEYPEITGYALTWLSALPDPSPNELAAARRAARWLVGRLESGNLSARDGWDDDRAYAFDLAMIASGLIRHGRATGESASEGAGIELAHRLAGEFSGPFGPRSILGDSSSKRGENWSTAGIAHLGKCTQAFLLAGGNDEAAALVERVLADQRDDGAFATQPDPGLVMLHPHLYAVEGLWMWASARSDEAVMEHARRGAAWAASQQLPSGGFPRAVSADGDAHPEQFDVTGQTVRSAILTGADPQSMEGAVERLIGVATPAKEGMAIPYQPASEPHLNSWASMFSAQALEVAAGRDLQWAELV